MMIKAEASLNLICFKVFDFVSENAWLSLDKSIDN